MLIVHRKHVVSRACVHPCPARVRSVVRIAGSQAGHSLEHIRAASLHLVARLALPDADSRTLHGILRSKDANFILSGFATLRVRTSNGAPQSGHHGRAEDSSSACSMATGLA